MRVRASVRACINMYVVLLCLGVCRVCVHMRKYTQINVCKCVCVCVCSCLYVYACVYACVRACMRTGLKKM